MKIYFSKSAILLYVNLLIGIIHCLHEFELFKFIPDSYYILIPLSFLVTFTLWSISINLKKPSGGRSDIWKKL